MTEADPELDDHIDDDHIDDDDIDDDHIDDDHIDDDDVDEGNRVVGGVSRSVLDYLARAIVEDPDAVMIEIDEGRRNSVSLRLHVSPDDMGRVIGRRGRVAQAIRTVVRAAGAGEGVDAQVDIVD